MMPVTRTGNKVPAVFIVQLMDAIGPTRAHKRLGVSTTALYKARRTGKVSKVLEVAAEGALQASVRKTTGMEYPPPTRLARPQPNPLRKAPEPVAAAPAPAPEEKSLFLVEVPADKRDIVERIVLEFGAVVVH